jgi:hypothetical protein
MKANRMMSIESLRVANRFEGLRRILKSDAYSEHLEKPLAYWALPTDRRLPLAFLGRTLDDLLDTPFVDLSETPGIGEKKIQSFVKLLARVANTDPADLPSDIIEPVRPTGSNGNRSANGNGDGFDPATVSEVQWGQWRASVARHQLGGEILGRFAPSLQRVTKVIWGKSLGDYANLSLTEIRSMKTHGEKRVHAILEVFHCVHVMVAGMGSQSHLSVRIVPRLIDKVQQWTEQMLQTAGVPSEEAILENFMVPLLEQIRIDAPTQIANLAETRLGISVPITSVRQVARNMGLTRARVYQLLNEINDIITVRWPTGRHLVYELRHKFLTEAAQTLDGTDLKQFESAVELFYPASRRGADGALEQAITEDEDGRIEQ